MFPYQVQSLLGMFTRESKALLKDRKQCMTTPKATVPVLLDAGVASRLSNLKKCMGQLMDIKVQSLLKVKEVTVKKNYEEDKKKK